MIGVQLPLSVQLPEATSFDSYHAGPNQAVVDVLRHLADGDGCTTLIHGPAGCGKTHLLQATSRQASSRRLRAAYLPLASFTGEAADVLEGFDTVDLACIDDIDAQLQDRGWAQALLRLLDAIRSHGGRCLLASTSPPDRLAIARLPDLRTRLGAAAAFALRTLDDDAHADMLRERGRRLGLELGSETIHWMLTHLPRDTASLLRALNRLDQATLVARRKPSLGFVQKALAEPIS